jgi:UDP-glucoronosyl and UDP-glucosyl transferase
MVMSSVDTAPFGLGLQPSTNLSRRARNRLLNWFVQNVAFRDVQAHWQAMRARLQMGPTGWWLNHVTRSTFYLQPSVRGFEYPRSDLADNVEFIGMIPPEQSVGVAKPPFWDELDGSRPVVHVSQGTIANATPDLIAPTLEGLAGEDVLVVVSTGNRPIEQLKLGKLPQNARIAPFLSYPDLLPKTSVMVTNGGYGGVQMALSYGVPLVVAGASEDKPEVSARVAERCWPEPQDRKTKAAGRACGGEGSFGRSTLPRPGADSCQRVPELRPDRARDSNRRDDHVRRVRRREAAFRVRDALSRTSYS